MQRSEARTSTNNRAGEPFACQQGPPPERYSPPTQAPPAPNRWPPFAISLSLAATDSVPVELLRPNILLELTKRTDIVVTDVNPLIRWELVCVAPSSVVVCSSVALEDADLAEVERYFPDVAHYGVWWVKRYLLEHEGGIVANHSILTSSAVLGSAPPHTPGIASIC